LATKASQSATQIALSIKSDKANHSTSAEIASAYRTIAASNAGLALKRDIADSLRTTEIQGLVSASRPISSVSDLQAQLDSKAPQSATVPSLSFKVDKTGSISASESGISWRGSRPPCLVGRCSLTRCGRPLT